MELEKIAQNIVGRVFPSETRDQCTRRFMIATGKHKGVSKRYIDDAIKLKIVALKGKPTSKDHLDEILSKQPMRDWNLGE